MMDNNFTYSKELLHFALEHKIPFVNMLLNREGRFRELHQLALLQTHIREPDLVHVAENFPDHLGLNRPSPRRRVNCFEASDKERTVRVYEEEDEIAGGDVGVSALRGRVRQNVAPGPSVGVAQRRP